MQRIKHDFNKHAKMRLTSVVPLAQKLQKPEKIFSKLVIL